MIQVQIVCDKCHNGVMINQGFEKQGDMKIYLPVPEGWHFLPTTPSIIYCPHCVSELIKKDAANE